MPLSHEIVDSVANSNLSNVADAPAYYSGLSMGNAVAHQQSMQNIQLSAVGKIVKFLTEPDAEESMAVLKMMSGNDTASQISALMAAVAGSQQLSKTAGNTPPVKK